METGWTSEKLAAFAKPSDFAPLYIVSVRDKAESVWKVVEQSEGINDVSLYSPESSLVREGVISEMISPLDSRRLCPRPGIQALRSSTSENWWENERREREAVENIVIVLEWRLNRTDLQQPCKRLTRNEAPEFSKGEISNILLDTLPRFSFSPSLHSTLEKEGK